MPSPTRLTVDPSVRWKTITPTIYGRSVPMKIKTQVCMWYHVGHTRLMRMVLTRDPAGRIEDRAIVGNLDAIVPSIGGWARMHGLNTIFIDDRDPYRHGFVVN